MRGRGDQTSFVAARTACAHRHLLDYMTCLDIIDLMIDR